jgi:hypothetical protein
MLCCHAGADPAALEDAINIGRCSPHQIDRVDAVGQQASFNGLITIRVDGGQRVPSRQQNDQLTMDRGKRIRHHDQAATGLTRHRGYGTLDLPGVVDTRGNRFDSERAGRRSQRTAPSTQLLIRGD